MSDIALSKSNMMFVTQEGEGFSGQWLGEYKKITDKKGTQNTLYRLLPEEGYKIMGKKGTWNLKAAAI